MKVVEYSIHHQAIVYCPECEQDQVLDLGEDDLAEGMTVKCVCGCEFEIGEAKN